MLSDTFYLKIEKLSFPFENIFLSLFGSVFLYANRVKISLHTVECIQFSTVHEPYISLKVVAVKLISLQFMYELRLIMPSLIIITLFGHIISLLAVAASLQLTDFVISNINTFKIPSYGTVIRFKNFKCYYLPSSGFIS